MTAMKLISIGNSLGAIFPKDILTMLGASKGDTIYVTQMPNGEMKLSLLNQEVAEEVRIGEAFMDRYRDTFRALAK